MVILNNLESALFQITSYYKLFEMIAYLIKKTFQVTRSCRLFNFLKLNL